MRTVDHFMLGKYLIKTIRNYVSISVFCRASFVFGNIEPDLNFITFFKKEMKGKLCVDIISKTAVNVLKNF